MTRCFFLRPSRVDKAKTPSYFKETALPLARWIRRLLNKILFTIACLLLPILWGVFVNWLFNFWHRRKATSHDDEPVFPDYQI